MRARARGWRTGIGALGLSLALASLLAAPMPRASAPDPSERAAGRAAAYLWSQQAADGGWHSETYGLLRSGQALTPFVLHALLLLPEAVQPRPRDGVARALAWLRRHVDAEGFLGRADPTLPEYPTYATAFALRCLVRAGEPGDAPLIARMRAALVRSQLGAAGELPPEQPAWGGWGFGPERPRGSPGHVDLAHTRHALQALRAAGPEDSAGAARALTFLGFLQRLPEDGRGQPPYDEDPDRPVPADGGFYFSPVVLGASKGGVASGPDGRRHLRSYASATCDGLLALLAAGVPRGDARVHAAAAWLRAHPRWDHPEGVPADGPWGPAIRTYYLGARAEAYAALDWPGPWRARLQAALAPFQRPDGSFCNPEGFLMKEDDPLVCTALALGALARALPAQGAFSS